MRKGEQARDETIKDETRKDETRKDEMVKDETVLDVNGQILRDDVEVTRRWAGYFELVLNVADVREANINVVGNWRDANVRRFE